MHKDTYYCVTHNKETCKYINDQHWRKDKQIHATWAKQNILQNFKIILKTMKNFLIDSDYNYIKYVWWKAKNERK